MGTLALLGVGVRALPRSRAGWGFNVALGALLVASALYLAEERDALAQVHGMVRQIDMASLLDAPVSLHAVTQAWVDANLAGGGRSR